MNLYEIPGSFELNANCGPPQKSVCLSRTLYLTSSFSSAHSRVVSVKLLNLLIDMQHSCRICTTVISSVQYLLDIHEFSLHYICDYIDPRTCRAALFFPVPVWSCCIYVVCGVQVLDLKHYDTDHRISEGDTMNSNTPSFECDKQGKRCGRPYLYRIVSKF